MEKERIIEHAQKRRIEEIAKLDLHIPLNRLEMCVSDGFVYWLRDNDRIVGVLRYSLFWQMIPFLDFLFLDENYRRQGGGTAMMKYWEEEMKKSGYPYLMTSTQADETAWIFYEKLGFRKKGSFLPPDQQADEWIYIKSISGEDKK